MRVWIDISNSPQVPFFRPLIALLHERGHDVDVTTRRVRANASSCSRSTASSTRSSGRITAVRAQQARHARWPADSTRCDASRRRASSTSRSRMPRTSSRWSRARSAFRRHTHSTTSSPACNTASAVALRSRVVVPEAIPQGRLDRLGARSSKVRRYPGLKEEYYLAGFEPDPVCSRRAETPARPSHRSRADAARRVALPPSREPVVHRRAREARTRRLGARSRPPPDR